MYIALQNRFILNGKQGVKLCKTLTTRAFEMRCLRRVEGVTILDKVRNVDIRSRLGQVSMVSRVEKKKTE